MHNRVLWRFILDRTKIGDDIDQLELGNCPPQ